MQKLEMPRWRAPPRCAGAVAWGRPPPLSALLHRSLPPRPLLIPWGSDADQGHPGQPQDFGVHPFQSAPRGRHGVRAVSTQQVRGYKTTSYNSNLPQEKGHGGVTADTSGRPWGGRLVPARGGAPGEPPAGTRWYPRSHPVPCRQRGAPGAEASARCRGTACRSRPNQKETGGEPLYSHCPGHCGSHVTRRVLGTWKGGRPAMLRR